MWVSFMLCWFYVKNKCYVDFMLKNKSKENEILFIVIYCVRGKSIFSITQQNPVKAKDSS